jgi:hypothetical protein
MIENTSISEILAYILASILIGYSLRTQFFLQDVTSWVTLGAAMGFLLVGVAIRVATMREESVEVPGAVAELT